MNIYKNLNLCVLIYKDIIYMKNRGLVKMREEALEILFKYLETDRMRKHCYAVEAVMRT